MSLVCRRVIPLLEERRKEEEEKEGVKRRMSTAMEKKPAFLALERGATRAAFCRLGHTAAPKIKKEKEGKKKKKVGQRCYSVAQRIRYLTCACLRGEKREGRGKGKERRRDNESMCSEGAASRLKIIKPNAASREKRGGKGESRRLPKMGEDGSPFPSFSFPH